MYRTSKLEISSIDVVVLDISPFSETFLNMRFGFPFSFVLPLYTEIELFFFNIKFRLVVSNRTLGDT